jgi:hypothetical protein
VATANAAHNQDISRAECQELLVNECHYEIVKDNRVFL